MTPRCAGGRNSTSKNGGYLLCTFFEQVQGRGSRDGEPRRGTHTWPEMNSAMMTVVEDDRVEELLQTVRKLDNRNREVGVRAFVWNIERTV